MYRVVITEYAEQDMLRAAEYIAEDLHNRQAADQLLNDAEKTIYPLEEMPFRYPLVTDNALAGEGFRFFPVHNYLVFYVVREERKFVVIERFLYKRHDWAVILSGIQKNEKKRC